MRDPSTYRPATHLEQPPDGYTSEDTATAIDPATSDEVTPAIVYVVTGESGEYSNWTTWLVSAHGSEEDAKLVAVFLNSAADLGADAVKKYDPGATHNYPGPSYSVDPLPAGHPILARLREIAETVKRGTVPEETLRRQLQEHLPASDEPPTAIGVDVGAPEGDKTVIVGPLPTSLAYGSRR